VKRRARLLLTLALSAVLALTGAGVSYALWTTSATVGSTASTATVTVGHALTGSSLAVTYGPTTTAAVGVITVTNTGTRNGSYSLALSATSASSTMRAATTVEIGTAATCTTAATLSGAVTGSFAATVTKTGTIAAGASVALCVRTSMSAANISANASASLAASAATSITVGTWSASAAAPITFAQSVAAPTGFQSVEGNRYKIYNANICISSTWDYTQISRGAVSGGDCNNDQTSNWRFYNDASGAKYIARAYNTGSTPDNRWNATSATALNLASSSAVAAQRWMITARADSTFQIQNVAQSKCVAVASNGTMLLETCNASSAGQGFTFETVADSTPAPVTLTCGGNGSNYIHYSWPVLTGYQAEVTYKVYLDDVYFRDHTNGYYTTEQFNFVDLPAAIKAVGVHTVRIEQSVSGAAYTVTGTGTLRVAATTFNMSCS
jgi:hypothetical protein